MASSNTVHQSWLVVFMCKTHSLRPCPKCRRAMTAVRWPEQLHKKKLTFIKPSGRGCKPGQISFCIPGSNLATGFILRGTSFGGIWIGSTCWTEWRAFGIFQGRWTRLGSVSEVECLFISKFTRIAWIAFLFQSICICDTFWMTIWYWIMVNTHRHHP